MNQELKSLKRRFILSILSLCLVVTLALAGVFAWYYIGDKTGQLQFQVLQIDSVVTMYEATDLNKNGVPDLLATNNHDNNTYQYTDENSGTPTYVVYDLPYYTEIYDFTYHDTTLVLERDSIANLFNPITLKDLFPSRVYTLKYALGNYNFATNTVTFQFDTETSIENETVSLPSVLSQFRLRLAMVNDDGSLTFGEWTQFDEDSLQNLPMTINDIDITIDPYSTNGQGRLDIWLQIQFLPEAGNEMEDQTIVFPDFRITFDATIDA